MNPRERGFLLLSSHLGDPDRKPLTRHQLGLLARRTAVMEQPDAERELTVSDLLALGYDRDMARRILALLEDEELLDRYLSRAEAAGCLPLTRVSPAYPALLRRRLGAESPGCLWARGDVSLLKRPGVALVGSRDLMDKNRGFACRVGEMAAKNGLVLVSGNARGADRAAQDACLASGGQVISVLSDRLTDHAQREDLLYISEEGFEEAFSPQRALSRNRIIHCLGQVTFVAQAEQGKGGTWDGTVKNLRHGWSTVACFRDGSPASLALEQQGAWLIGQEELEDFTLRPLPQLSFFE